MLAFDFKTIAKKFSEWNGQLPESDDPEFIAQRDALTAVFNNLFTISAVDPSDLSRHLFSVIEAHPPTACAQALARSLYQSSQASPPNVHTFVQATLDVFAHYLDIEMDKIEPDPAPWFYVEFRCTLVTIMALGFGLTGIKGDRLLEITPSNPMLQAAIFSGSIVAADSTESHPSISDISALYSEYFVDSGLWVSNRIQIDRHEVRAIGACLQLAIAGAQMIDPPNSGSDFTLAGIVKALKRLKKSKLIQHPGGVQLLETTIALAKNDFTECISPAQSWAILFPDEALLADSPRARSSSRLTTESNHVSSKVRPTRTSMSVFHRGIVGRTLGADKSFPNTAGTPSMNPRREFHSLSSSASISIFALANTQHRLVTSPVNGLTTHYAQRSMISTTGRHMPMNVRRYSHVIDDRSSFWIGRAGIQGRKFMKILRFVP